MKTFFFQLFQLNSVLLIIRILIDVVLTGRKVILLEIARNQEKRVLDVKVEVVTGMEIEKDTKTTEMKNIEVVLEAGIFTSFY